MTTRETTVRAIPAGLASGSDLAKQRSDSLEPDIRSEDEERHADSSDGDLLHVLASIRIGALRPQPPDEDACGQRLDEAVEPEPKQRATACHRRGGDRDSTFDEVPCDREPSKPQRNGQMGGPSNRRRPVHEATTRRARPNPGRNRATRCVYES